jgi:hypothetical protein
MQSTSSVWEPTGCTKNRTAVPAGWVGISTVFNYRLGCCGVYTYRSIVGTFKLDPTGYYTGSFVG